MKHQLLREQQLNCDLTTAWRFFSNPYNLSKITPKEMGFEVLTPIKDVEIYEGMLIEYKVSPLLRIPLRWKTIITQVAHNESFTDFQEKGPYKLWIHHHQFTANEGGVLMNDTLDYELPLGFLGEIAHWVMVKNKLKRIFDYRYRVLEEMFHSEK